ncbi:MAG: hypothetical protein WDW38_000895 [Sanguina aurantia]
MLPGRGPARRSLRLQGLACLGPPAPTSTATTLPDAFQSEPLAAACLSALQAHAYVNDGSGLKLLRLVSKQIRAAVTKSIRGYTLTIDGTPQQLPDVSLLQLTQLSRLHLVVVADPVTHRIGPGHRRQVKAFISAVAPALHSVAAMDIKLQVQDKFSKITDSDVAKALSPLAKACPRVQQLKVTGLVGPTLLAAFGTSCQHLTRLETEDIPAHTAERLGELLPRVTSTTIVLDEYDIPDEYIGAIRSCATLVSLDLNTLTLSEGMWGALPPGLRRLHAAKYDFGTSSCPTKELPNLRRACCIAQFMELCAVAALLRAAPGLEKLVVGDVWAPSRLDQIPDLVYVNAQLATKRFKMRHIMTDRLVLGDGVLLSLRNQQTPWDFPGQLPDPSFAASLPVLEHFQSVEVQTVDRGLLASLARAFPRLHVLVLCDVMHSRDLPSLAVFTTLQKLCFQAEESVYSDCDLGALCLQMPSLSYLGTATPGNNCLEVKKALRTWGRRVEVETYRVF